MFIWFKRYLAQIFNRRKQIKYICNFQALASQKDGTMLFKATHTHLQFIFRLVTFSYELKKIKQVNILT